MGGSGGLRDQTRRRGSRRDGFRHQPRRRILPRLRRDEISTDHRGACAKRLFRHDHLQNSWRELAAALPWRASAGTVKRTLNVACPSEGEPMTESVRATSAVVDFVARTRWRDFPADAVALAKRCLIDGLG